MFPQLRELKRILLLLELLEKELKVQLPSAVHLEKKEHSQAALPPVPPYVPPVSWGWQTTNLPSRFIGAFTAFPADSLVFKLTCQHCAFLIRGRWVEKEVSAGYPVAEENMIHPLPLSCSQQHFQECTVARSWGSLHAAKTCFCTVTAGILWPVPEPP